MAAAEPTADAVATASLAAAGEARRIGEYLPVSEEQIREVLSKLGAGATCDRLGEALLTAGLITRDQLLDALHQQRKDRLRSVTCSRASARTSCPPSPT